MFRQKSLQSPLLARLWLSLVLAAAIALSACSPMLTIGPDSTMPPEQGFLITQVVRADDKPLEKWNRLEVWSFTTKEVIKLRPVQTGARSTTLFAAFVPPGDYRLDALVTMAQGEIVAENGRMGLAFPSTAIPVHEILGTFSVRTGQVTDLGTIAYVPFPAGKTNEDRFLIGLRPGDTSARQLVSERFPAVDRQTRNLPRLGWNPGDKETKLAAVFDRVRHVTSQINQLQLGKDGELLAGSGLGQVLARSKEGRWRSYDTGIHEEILSAIALPNGEIMAGGEHSRLLLSDKGRTVWQQLSLPEDGVVEALGRGKDDNYYALLRTASMEVRILRASAARPDRWTAIHTTKFFGHLSSMGAPAQLLLARGLRAAVPPVYVAASTSPGEQWTDYKAVSMTQMMSGRDYEFLSIKLNEFPDGRLYGVGYSNWGFAKDGEGRWGSGYWVGRSLITSADDGATWSYLYRWQEPHNLMAASFFSDKAGFVLLDEHGTKAETAVLFTQDVGHSWTKRSPVPARVGRLFALPNGQELLAYNDQGVVYASRDRGQTWRMERQP